MDFLEPLSHIADGYSDAQQGVDRSVNKTLEAGTGAAFGAGASVVGASLAGAGPLAGYAGMASAVSTLGLGGATTAVAGMLGSGATGAAATAVVTSALGGPLVMGAILAGGVGATAYGLYQFGGWIGEQLK